MIWIYIERERETEKEREEREERDIYITNSLTDLTDWLEQKCYVIRNEKKEKEKENYFD